VSSRLPLQETPRIRGGSYVERGTHGTARGPTFARRTGGRHRTVAPGGPGHPERPRGPRSPEQRFPLRPQLLHELDLPGMIRTVSANSEGEWPVRPAATRRRNTVEHRYGNRRDDLDQPFVLLLEKRNVATPGRLIDDRGRSGPVRR